MTEAITVRGLRKRYGSREVLRGVDLTVPSGSIYALLGTNGAGKTTTLECIEGLRRSDGGEIHLNGRLGIQLQSASLPEHIRGGEAIRLFSAWNHVPAHSGTLEALGAGALEEKQYREMSTGQKRRLHLALALIGDPDIVLLDEPTAGLDVEGRMALHDYIRTLRGKGKTVLLSSHDMTEVEELCDGIAILRDGKAAFAGTPAELTVQLGTRYNVRITTCSGTDSYEVDDAASGLISLLEDYRSRNVAVQDIEVNRGSLEQHFARFTSGGER